MTLLAFQHGDKEPARVLEMRVDAQAGSCKRVTLSIHAISGLPCTHQRSRFSAPALLGGQCVSSIFDSARLSSGTVAM